MWERAKASYSCYGWRVAPPFHPLMTLQFSGSFLVNACMCLMAHINTEGLFRKSGSVVRLKALKVRNGLKLTQWPLKLPHLAKFLRIATPFLNV